MEVRIRKQREKREDEPKAHLARIKQEAEERKCKLPDEHLAECCLRWVCPERDSLDFFMVKRLVENTWVNHQVGPHSQAYFPKGVSPTGIIVRAVYRIENAALREKYESRRRWLKKKLCVELQMAPISTEARDVMLERQCAVCMKQPNDAITKIPCSRSRGIPSDARLTAHYNSKLEKDDTYLFHGTPYENVFSIAENGFQINTYGKKGLYGTGLYLAESSEKSDPYAGYVDARRTTSLTMIVVRTQLGRVQAVTCDCRYHNLEASHECDSYVAGFYREFREFVLHDAVQAYPEFVVVYDRQI